MLLGMFSAIGVLRREFKRAYSLGDLLTQHLDKLEQEAERKRGVLQALADHFTKVFEAPVLRSAIAVFDAISLAPKCADTVSHHTVVER
jgi:hypothetical protein